MLDDSTWQPLAFWMRDSQLNTIINGSGWIFPASEKLHFLGLIMLFGSLLIMDMRILGFARSLPIKPLMGFTPFTIIGFAINLVTGIIFLFADPVRYFPNLSWQLKMLCLAGAAANVLYFKFVIYPVIERDGDAACARLDARIVAAASLSLWALVIIFGRLIPYLGSDGG
jgi:hypothetical protein